MTVPHINTHTNKSDSSALHRSLLDAVAKADVTATLQALQAGVDLHVVDANGRTVVGCTIAGERWEEADASDASFRLEQRLEILKALVHHNKISLAALNAPLDAMRGVTPLGLAAWLNIPEIVRTLLDECPGLVSVNGVDASGATPLMYAARDGCTEVVHDLLMNGARPDYRDVNHRSSIQYALRHPQVLWLCESALRRHRASDRSCPSRSSSRRGSQSRERPETEPYAIVCHPRLALKPSTAELLDMIGTLISAVKADDPQGLYSILLPSSSSVTSTPPLFLINYPDAQGWSAIHYCVTAEHPNSEVLDILYRAGADLCLYTRSGHGMPLHCLARHTSKASSPAIHEFIRHLVLDLRTPLAAKDAENETCLHTAAEHGNNLDILTALLACDTTGTVREMRNSRGLTALEVAQPRFRAAFARSSEIDRSASSASVRTIKPSTASAGLSKSLLCPDPLRLRVPASTRKYNVARDSISDLNMKIFPHSILENLLTTSHQLSAGPEDIDHAAVDDLLQQTTEMGEDLLVHMQARLNHAAEDLDATRQQFALTGSLVEDAKRVAVTAYGGRIATLQRTWDTPSEERRRTTDSEGSEKTVVSCASVSNTNLLQIKEKNASDAYILLSVQGSSTSMPQYSYNTDALESPSIAPAYPSSLHEATHFLRPTKSLVDLREKPNETPEDKGFLKLPWVKDITRRRSKSDIQAHVDASERASFLWIGDSQEPASSGVSRVKAWFRKKLMPDLPPQLIVTKSKDLVSTANSSRGRSSVSQAPRPSTSSSIRPHSGHRDSATVCRVVSIANGDLRRIQEYIDVAERYIDHASRSITQARQLLSRSIEHRKTQLIHAKNILDLGSIHLAAQRQSDTFDFLPVTIPTSIRDSQLVFPKPPSISSSMSSDISFSSTLNEEDEDIRALRRLLTRKIETRTDNACEHLAKSMVWLQIVKDVTRTLRRNIDLRQLDI